MNVDVRGFMFYDYLPVLPPNLRPPYVNNEQKTVQGKITAKYRNILSKVLALNKNKGISNKEDEKDPYSMLIIETLELTSNVKNLRLKKNQKRRFSVLLINRLIFSRCV